MAVDSVVADSSAETLVAELTTRPTDSSVTPGSSSSHRSNSNSRREQASPDSSSAAADEQVACRVVVDTVATAEEQSETVVSEMSEQHHRTSSVIRSIRPSIKQETMPVVVRPPRIEVIVGPRQFEAEFRPMQRINSQQRMASSPTPRPAHTGPVVSSSTSPGPSSSPSVVIMGPPPPPPPPQPPALNLAVPKNKMPRVRKSGGGQRRQQQPAIDQEEPSSSIPEIGKLLAATFAYYIYTFQTLFLTFYSRRFAVLFPNMDRYLCCP